MTTKTMFAFNSSTSLLCLEYTLDLKIQTRAEIRVSYLETCSQYVLTYHFFKNKALNEKKCYSSLFDLFLHVQSSADLLYHDLQDTLCSQIPPLDTKDWRVKTLQVSGLKNFLKNFLVVNVLHSNENTIVYNWIAISFPKIVINNGRR